MKLMKLLTAAAAAVVLTTACSKLNIRANGNEAKTGTKPVAQPAQPALGPGGSQYLHADMTAEKYGAGKEEYWIFEPAAPKPEEAPVIIFLHGWGAMNPKVYGAWITHLVRRGNIVVYPRYQTSLTERPPDMAEAAPQAVKDALQTLKRSGHVRPDLDRVAVVGHSLGGALAGNIAALSGEDGMPEIQAAMPVEPGDSAGSKTSMYINRKVKSLLGDFSKIPAGTLLLCVAGKDDRMAGSATAKKICGDAKRVPPENKLVIIIRSDYHGTPALKADHSMPAAGNPAFSAIVGEMETDTAVKEFTKDRMEKRRGIDPELNATPDALDYYGPWRLFDALTDCAFYNKNCDQSIQDGPALRNMGKWSDGAPVVELATFK